LGAEDQRPIDAEELRQRAHLATTLLHEVYGSPRHDNKDDPLDELIFIILSQMTTRQSYGRVYDRLKTTYPSWEAILDLPLDELKEAIRDAGLINQKAPRIKAILATLKEDFGNVTLDPLREMSDEEAERYLTSLPGVGLKTAKCVLALSSLQR
jgi:endonuclease III